MKIIIAGCGKIGVAAIESLVNEGHDVIAIDNRMEAVEEIRDVYDIMCLCSNGADFNTLNEAGVQDADMFIAVTGSDELNMLSCIIAKKMGAKHTVARVRNPEYNDKSLGFIKQQIELSLILNPEYLVAQEIFNILKFPAAVNVETFSRRNFEMAELLLRDNSPIVGMSLMELRKKFQANYLICVVQRGEDVFIPDGNFVLQSGDRIGITADPNEIQKLLKMIGILQKSVKNVMILGGGRIAYYLSKMLISSGNSVKIIDNDRNRCEVLSDILPQANIINGDGTDQSLLIEEGLTLSDSFVALTGMDEENILLSIFATTKQVKKVIAKVNGSELSDLAEKLGLDCIVTPKQTVSGIISRYARAIANSEGSNVETLYKLMDGMAEAAEFNVAEDFEYKDIPIKELRLKKNILLAGIIRKRKAIIPSGDDVIKSGDKAIVIAAKTVLNDLSDIMR
ncbi:MAG: Trk system potassium transporter TrkA [Clostridia bacterium]|nr:Trk system potassium transporter TrkA [Clostridia bacterium]